MIVSMKEHYITGYGIMPENLAVDTSIEIEGSEVVIHALPELGLIMLCTRMVGDEWNNFETNPIDGILRGRML